MCFSFNFLKKQLFLICVIIPLSAIFSQDNTSNTTNEDAKRKFIDDVRLGGGIGLGFGNNFFNGALSPTAIYIVNDVVSIGAGYNFAFTNRKYVYSSLINGGRFLGLYTIIPQLQLSTEYELNHVNIKFKDNSALNNEKYWVPSLFLGLGYKTGNVIFGLRYDVLYNSDKSIYGSPYVPFARIFF